jgi:ferredoxin-type protein NapH
MVMFPVTMNFLSPYVILNASFEGVIAGSFLFFILLFVSSLLIGRAFCGWVCPGGAVQEMCFPIRNKKVRGKAVLIKYFIWVPWLASIVLAAISAGGYHQIDPLYFTESGVSVDSVNKLIVFVFIVALLFTLSVTVGRRAACHTVCWMAPFMVIGKRLGRLLHIPGLNIETSNTSCTDCRQCEARCPMSLSVSAMVKRGEMKNDDCILCGLCVDTCPNKVLSYSFSVQKPVNRQKNDTAIDSGKQKNVST